MTPAAIIREAAADGVSLVLSPTGTIKATGNQAAVNRWLPVLREHKPELLAALAKPTPAADLGVAADLDFAATYDDPVQARYDAAWKRRAAAEPGFEPTAQARYCCECSNLAPDKRCTAWQRLGAPAGWEPSDKAPRKCRGFVPARDGSEITLKQASDLRKHFEERAANLENDGALPRKEAEPLVVPDDNRNGQSGDYHRVDAHTLIAEACRSVSGITPEQFRSLCVPVDIADIEAGRIPIQSLRAYAQSFAEGIRTGRITVLAAAIPKTTLPLCVRCADCRHFERDTIGDGAGIGRCKIGGEGAGPRHPALWPRAERKCKDFECQA